MTMFRFNGRNILLLVAVWAVTGFILGTETLLGPSRWIADYARSAPEHAYVEGPAVRSLILVLMAVSLVLALLITKAILLSDRKHVRFGMPLLLGIFLTATLYMWFNPEKFGNAKPLTSGSKERFTVGPYPDLGKLKELKQDGYTGVISLLHPAVVPFETSLIETEKANAKAVGIEVQHLPMLPWISDNRESLAKLGEIASKPGGRYYLHCYLGKDRVNVALRRIAEADPSSTGIERMNLRQLSMRRRLERGRVMKPAENVFVVPYPTHEELFGYILAEGITNVVCLMDPEEEGAAKVIGTADKDLGDHGVKLTRCPIVRRKYDAEAARRAATMVKTMNGTVVVFDFVCPSFRTEAFIQALGSDLPALPPSFAGTNLLVAPVRHVAQNALCGRRPERLKEFEQLEDIGIRKFMYVGKGGDPEAVRDSEFTKAGKFDWRVVDPLTEEADKLLAEGGPWYVYGRIQEEMVRRWEKKHGPPYVAPADHIVIPLAEKTPPPGPTRYEQMMAAISGGRSLQGVGGVARAGLDFVMGSAASPRMIILLVPFSFFYTYLCASLAGWLRMARDVRVSYTRKVFHFLIFTMACVVQAAGGTEATVIFGTVVCCCVMYAMLRGEGFGFYEAMARPTDAPHRSLYVFVPMVTTAVGGVLANIFFQPVALIGYLVGGWGDAVGEPVGAKFGKHKYRVLSLMGVPATRSLEGSAAVAIASFLAAWTGLALVGTPMEVAVPVALICAFASCVTEAFSSHGLDNLTVQVVACAVLYYLLRSMGQAM